MKVAISLPDSTFESAERVARGLGISRSQLYARAVKEFVKSHRGVDIRETLDKVYGSEPSALDPLLERLQAEALRERW
jgi:metal-responsive CopG/Arc/MetJ family transcriptional regulator